MFGENKKDSRFQSVVAVAVAVAAVVSGRDTPTILGW